MKRPSLLLRVLLLSLVVSAAVALSGCSFDVHEHSLPSSRSTTVGQELIDLKRAYEGGAMTSSEYEEKKAELLDHSH